MAKVILFITALISLHLNSFAQVIPPCGNDYGTNTDEDNIVAQMRYGSISDAANAIAQAKNSRGNSLGCPQQALSYNTVIATTEPSLSDIVTVWNTVHVPAINAYTVACPRIGRYENNAALGAYYAMQAGYYSDTSELIKIADMMYSQQYASWNALSPQDRNEGAYGYVNTINTDPCYIGGVVGSSVNTLCSNLPAYCVTYNTGQYAGYNFAISGQDDLSSWFDGGLAYDHGWVGAQMIEAAILQKDLTLKQKYRNSLDLAGKYAISEYCVKNHNYTAKLIWLLAELYAWTGNSIYKDELNYKLDKSLIPGILYDADNDGNVDGTFPPISFNALTPNAQIPGRMWDGHNALPWYHAMNTWALTEAYVAFRDQGDITRANEIKPYVVAMLNNLSNEIITQGVMTPDALGVRDITYALLIGIWKISQYEMDANPTWEQAAWRMWNSGYFTNYSTHSVCVGLYLLVKSSTLYKPFPFRENYILSNNAMSKEKSTIQIYPNPAIESLYISQKQAGNNFDSFEIIDITGRQIKTGVISSAAQKVSLEGLQKGMYSLLLKGEGITKNVKFIKE